MSQEIENLLKSVAREDRVALSRLYDLTSAKLFGICLRVLNERAAAEDALQDAFVKVWRHADRYQVNGLSPMTWLITIARNTAIDLARSRGRAGVQTGLDEATFLPAPGATPEGAIIAKGEAKRIAGCLEELTREHRMAVRGAYLEGQTYAQLADAAGVPVNTMRTWLRRSLLKLKACLQR